MLSESKIQQSIVMWFRNTYCLASKTPRSLIISIPNGGTRNKREAIILNSTGLYAGASDIIIHHNGHLLFIEVKTEDGAQSDKQILFQKHVESMRLQYYIVRSLDQFKSIIFSVS